MGNSCLALREPSCSTAVGLPFVGVGQQGGREVQACSRDADWVRARTGCAGGASHHPSPYLDRSPRCGKSLTEDTVTVSDNRSPQGGFPDHLQHACPAPRPQGPSQQSPTPFFTATLYGLTKIQGGPRIVKCTTHQSPLSKYLLRPAFRSLLWEVWPTGQQGGHQPGAC